MLRATLLAAMGIALLTPQEAEACRGGFVRMFVDLNEQKEQMEEIEENIKDGHIRRSFLEARRLERSLRRIRYGYAGFPARAMRSLRRRIDFVKAVAIVRLGGRVGNDAESMSKEERTENLEWALNALQEHHEQDPTSLSQARLAEAMAQFDEQREQAAEILQGLSDRDVMPDTYGYRTLAMLQSSLGNNEQAAQASRACILSASTRELAMCPVMS